MAKTKPASPCTRLVVADAGPLIHLDELSALDVLSDYAEIFVPDAVWLEVQHHRPQALQRTFVNLHRQPPPPASAKINAITDRKSKNYV